MTAPLLELDAVRIRHEGTARATPDGVSLDIRAGEVVLDAAGRLVRPTLDALDGGDVLVVVATGGRPVEEVGPLPSNARAAEFLPYDLLMPKVDVFVTNAGFGGTQYALSHGVPIVAAGDTEDKPEVSTRVEWAGVGVNLKTGTPPAADVRAGVERVLGDPGYRERARALARRIRDMDTFGMIAAELEAAAARTVGTRVG